MWVNDRIHYDSGEESLKAKTAALTEARLMAAARKKKQAPALEPARLKDFLKKLH